MDMISGFLWLHLSLFPHLPVSNRKLWLAVQADSAGGLEAQSLSGLHSKIKASLGNSRDIVLK